MIDRYIFRAGVVTLIHDDTTNTQQLERPAFYHHLSVCKCLTEAEYMYVCKSPEEVSPLMFDLYRFCKFSELCNIHVYMYIGPIQYHYTCCQTQTLHDLVWIEWRQLLTGRLSFPLSPPCVDFSSTLLAMEYIDFVPGKSGLSENSDSSKHLPRLHNFVNKMLGANHVSTILGVQLGT